MIGYRFYQEFRDQKTKKRPSGNVVAVSVDNKGHPNYYMGTGAMGIEAMVEVISAVVDVPNSSVAGGSASRHYLITYTKRISEEKAREIHPNLFRYLDDK